VKLEAQLYNAEKKKKSGWLLSVALASAIAHEIRNPLNYINLTASNHLQTKFLRPEIPAKAAEIRKPNQATESPKSPVINDIASTEFLNYSLGPAPAPQRLPTPEPIDLLSKHWYANALRISLKCKNYGKPVSYASVTTNGHVPQVIAGS